MTSADKGSESRPFRVLCIDGGGMRGIYTAAYLDELGRRFAAHRGLADAGLDIGKGFDLLVGTSTGAIVAAALAVPIRPQTILSLYRDEGSKIFPEKVPNSVGWQFLKQLITRPKNLKRGNKAFVQALTNVFGEMTLGELYKNRGIALAVPAVEMARHHAWVFKTKHLPNSLGRDDNYTLRDVCLATSAAPIYRSLAAINNPDSDGYRVFADGGLYANTPILIGLVDALQMASKEQSVEIFGLGNCKRPEGDSIGREQVHLGFIDWKIGARAITLSMDAQEDVSWQIARLLCSHMDRDIRLIRFPRGTVASSIHDYLDLDETKTDAADALIAQAQADVVETFTHCTDQYNEEGQRLMSLFMQVPPYSDENHSA